MTVQMIKIDIAVDGSGDFTTDTPHVEGRFLQYFLDYGDTATGADLDIVGKVSGQIIVNHDSLGTADIQRAPRQPTHDKAGAASNYSSTNSEPVEDYYYVNEELIVTIANGGDTKVGVLYLWIG